MSAALHIALVALFLLASPAPPDTSERASAPEPVAWVRTSPAPHPAPASARAHPAAAAALPPPVTAPRPVSPRLERTRQPLRAGAPTLSDAELAGAASAGSGEGNDGDAGAGAPGGACDMPRRLQAALRRDGRVQAAAARGATGGRPLLVWNGDWAPSEGEDGRGLAAVREALIWEIGFAPESCRRQPVAGLVLLSLGDGAAAPRLVLGTRAWRWADLVLAR